MQTFFQNVQNINIAGRIQERSTSTRCRASDTDALYASAPEMRDKIAEVAGPARRHHAISTSRIRR